MGGWLCRLWEILAENQSNYDPFARNHADWWQGIETRRSTVRRNEDETLERIRDQSRR